MPPRVVKRGAAAAGQRRVSRATRGASKVQYQQPDAAEEVVKDASVGPVKVMEEEEEDGFKVHDKPIIEEETHLKLNLNGLPHTKKGSEMKGSVDEYEKDERLELDDNDPEYEPEEYAGVDYDEKETDAEEVGDEVEEDQPDEEHDVEEKEVSLSEDEDVPEGESVDDDDNHAAEEVEHADLADAAEHEERHEVVKERRKRKQFELFVGVLDKDATEDDIREVFSQVGEAPQMNRRRNYE